MKLEKFDYQIGNKKAKREFVALGVLCLALVVTVVLYKTFANFSSTTSYSIIGGRVAPFNDSRKAIVTKDISSTKNDEVNCILYDDGALNISGKGNMKDFTDRDLLAEIIDDYILSKVDFSKEESEFIDNHKKLMNSLFDIVMRPWTFEIKDEKIDEFLTNTFKTVDENNEEIIDEASINIAKAILTKVKESNFYLEKIEITEEVSNIGANAFALLAATNESETRDKAVYSYFYNGTDYANNANMPILLNVINLDASLNEVKSHGVSDLNATGIEIGDSTTKIPNDMFAFYNDKNNDLIIPDQVKSIGINAFYSFNGKSITLPGSINSIEEYAFASYNGNNITIPNSLLTYKPNVFRDFEKEITVNACESESLSAFAPKATFNYLKENCS